MKPNQLLCLLSDFGLGDRFVGMMKGVACSIDPALRIHDISHLIRPFDILAASCLLSDTIGYWPAGTTFVAVVDPGVGSGRKCLAALTKSGHYIICPDNGVISDIVKSAGLHEIRWIEPTLNHFPGRKLSATFHGRDLFVYNAALLASGKRSYENLGFLYKGTLVKLPDESPEITKNKITGKIIYLEEPFGNLCTNVTEELLPEYYRTRGGEFRITIRSARKIWFSENVVFGETFSNVPEGKPLLYIDSNGRLGVARNRGRFFTHGEAPDIRNLSVLIERVDKKKERKK
jgi:S-adenosylmethionine hydrolase